MRKLKVKKGDTVLAFSKSFIVNRHVIKIASSFFTQI